MNNNEFYVRRDDRTALDEAASGPQAEETAAALAVHRDPSVPMTPLPPESSEAKTQRGVAWVRPTDFPTMIGSKWAGRGIDLQSELARRSRRAPLKAAQAGRRISRSAIARPATATSTVTTTEELGL